ncbi:MAG: hypothetical protein D6785_10500, partial [Planctomycetota bacterium]
MKPKLSFAHSLPLLFRLFRKEQTQSWKGLVAWILLGFPVFVTLLAQFNPNPSKIPPKGWFLFMINNLFFQYFLWLIPFLYASEAVIEEIRKGTIHFIWHTPLPKSHFLGAKFLITLWWTLPGILITETLCFLIWRIQDFYLLLALYGITLLGCLYFISVFLAIGVFFKKPMAAGILYGFFVEVVLSTLVDSEAHKLPALHKLYGLIARFDPKISAKELAKYGDPFWNILFLLGG